MNEVIIYLGQGQIESGFSSVNIEFKQQGRKQSVNQCSLAPTPELRALLNQWQLLYQIELNSPQNHPHSDPFTESDRMLMLSPTANTATFDDATITNSSVQDIEKLKDYFKRLINDWLAQGSFGQIIGELRSKLDPQAVIVVTIVAEQQSIWQLPWHFWNFFESYPHACEVFSKPNFNNITDPQPQRNGRVNILGVFGQDPRLEINPGFIPNLSEVKSKLFGLPGDSRPALREIADALGNFQSDIFVFFGHGDTQSFNQTDSLGFVYLDDDTPIEIRRLRDTLKEAVDRGLQIAIFSCCRGLGLADRLSDVNLPYMTVMREKIPNLTAQSFLADLLRFYSQGVSFPEAFRSARAQMILSEDSFAYFADWLPILFHNPLSHAVTWQDLCRSKFSISFPPQVIKVCSYLSHPKRQVWTGIGVSLLTSILALSLQSNSTITKLEDWAIDPIQVIQASQIDLGAPKVKIINDVSVFPGMTTQNNAEPLAEEINNLSEKFQPLMWIINEDFEHNSDRLENRTDIILHCKSRIEPLQEIQYFKPELDCINQAKILKPYLQQIPPQGIRLNRHLWAKIESIDLRKIQSLTVSELGELLTNNIIFVRIPSGDRSVDSRLNLDALALHQLTRAARSSFPLFAYWHDGLKLLWIFTWSAIIAIATWKLNWQILVILIVVGIGISEVLLFCSLGIPIVLSAMAMVLVGGAIFSIKQIAHRRSFR